MAAVAPASAAAVAAGAVAAAAAVAGAAVAGAAAAAPWPETELSKLTDDISVTVSEKSK